MQMAPPPRRHFWKRGDTVRKLMWFTIGFAAACGVSLYASLGVWGLLLAAPVLGTGLALCFGRTFRGKVVGLILLGASVGLLWVFGYHVVYLNTAKSYDGHTVSGGVVVTDYSFPSKTGITADGSITLDGRSYPVRIYWESVQPLQPGDRIAGEVQLQWTAAGGLKEATHHSGNGTLLLGYVSKSAVLEKTEQPSWLHFPARLRRSIGETVERYFPEDVAGFARALLIGDTSALSYDQDVALQTSGIRHVVAVSGLHVSILFSFAYTVAGKRRIWTAVLGIPLLVLFAAVAGFSPSVLRACLMQILMILSLLLNKEYDPPTALATAVLCMLLCNPVLVTSASLQLSVGCIIGIFLFCQPIHDYLLRGRMGKLAKGKTFLPRSLRWIVSTVAVSISATVATTPLTAWYFGTVSLVGIFTNLLTLWLISFVFYGIMAVCVLSLLWTPLSAAIAWVLAWPIRYVLGVAKLLSRLPLSAVYTCSIYIVIWLVLAYVLLGVLLRAKKKRPGVLLSAVLLTLSFAVGASWLEPRTMPIHATVVDVGQGQCVLLFSESGTYMVDCGGENGKIAANSAAQLLLSRGITHLDGLILTHYDEDHAGGAGYFLSRFSVDRLYLPDIADDGGLRRELEQSFQSQIVWVREDMCLGQAHHDLWLYPGEDGKNENESSLSVLFQKESCDILITGDLGVSGEEALLQQRKLPKLELLVAGHHGSDTSTGTRLLKETSPDDVAISVGKNNHYGHPSKIVTERLKYYGCRVWRTDLDGTIDFRG